MGKIKKILENELIGGTQSTDVYPVTSVKAVYDENNERLDNIINRKDNEIKEELKNKVARLDKKIDDKTSEINVAKEEALQAIAKNEQSAITNFNSQRVTPEMLSESTKQLIKASGGGTITNLADDEDITSVDDGTGSNVLKFADRTYNADNFSGKGYKILRKNMVDGVNILTQSMMQDTNTIYVIQYDFTLGENITIPENCILEFNGGSLNNRMITFSNTTLKGFIKFDNIQVNGNVSNYQLDATIFNKNDIGDSINKCAAICKRIVIPDGIFYSHTKIRLFQHTLCGTNKLNSTTSKGSSIIYTDIDDAAIECTNQVSLSNFRIQNTKNSLLNSIGLKCTGTVNINNILVTNYIKYGFVSDGGLYYSVIQGLHVGMEIGFGIGSIGIYLTGTANNSSTYNANENIFIGTVCQGGYEVLIKVVGNANTFLGGDFSVNTDNTTKRQLEILGALNTFIGAFYLENPDKCSLEPIYLYKTAKNNIINLSAPRIGKIKNESINYNLITTYDYVSFENDFKYLGENLFDYFFQIDEIANKLVSQGYYIEPYYGGNGGINNCKFSLLEEKYKGNSVLRMSFNNSKANNLTFSGTNEFINICSSKNELICVSAYIRSNIDNATIGLSNTNYEKINEWEFISIIIASSAINNVLKTLIKVKSSELLNGYIDVAGIKVNFINRDNVKKSPTVDYFNFYKNKEKIRLDYDFLAKLISKGTTEKRPILQPSDEGFEYYDSTLKKKILWNGTEWTNMDGTALG